MSTSTRKDRKEDENTSVPSPSQIQENTASCQQALDEQKMRLKSQPEKPQEIFLNIHKDLVTYKNKPFKLQEKLQITT